VVIQSYFRNAKPIPDGRYQAIPGRLTTQTSRRSISNELQIPGFLSTPIQSSVLDAGLEVKVVFVPEDPTIWPNPNIKRVYSMAEKMNSPIPGTHDLPGTLNISLPLESELTGIVVSRVDRADVHTEGDYWDWEGTLVIEDPLWRFYAPAGTISISLPPEFNPFTNGNEVWVTPWSASFSTPFEYDLFFTDQILGHMSSYSLDSYAVVAP
jgi:hypothetical protein